MILLYLVNIIAMMQSTGYRVVMKARKMAYQKNKCICCFRSLCPYEKLHMPKVRRSKTIDPDHLNLIEIDPKKQISKAKSHMIRIDVHDVDTAKVPPYEEQK